LDTIADLPRLADALARHGYEEEDVAAVMGGNWLRLLQKVLASQ
jgi:membrane dipeptidase